MNTVSPILSSDFTLLVACNSNIALWIADTGQYPTFFHLILIQEGSLALVNLPRHYFACNVSGSTHHFEVLSNAIHLFMMGCERCALLAHETYQKALWRCRKWEPSRSRQIFFSPRQVEQEPARHEYGMSSSASSAASSRYVSAAVISKPLISGQSRK